MSDADIKRVELIWANRFIGTAEALVAAGLCRLDQLPGTPGKPKSGCTYFAGELRKRGAIFDERYLHIVKRKYTYVVTAGIPAVERQRREAAEEDRLEMKRRAELETRRLAQDSAIAAHRASRSQADFTHQVSVMLAVARGTLEDGRDNTGAFPWKLPEPSASRLIAAIAALEAEVKSCTPVSSEPRRLSLAYSAARHG
jgi:hypothetical protein